MEVNAIGFKIVSQGFDSIYGKGTWKKNTSPSILMKKITGRKRTR
jgi:hypothetical protein